MERTVTKSMPPSRRAPQPDALDEERTLALSIFAHAIRRYLRCATGHAPQDLYDLELAFHWINSPENAWPAAFETSCGLFAVDTTRLRFTLARALRAHCSANG
jgi:hypothetical protein